MYTRHVFIFLVGLLAFSGCTNLGPRTVPRDRFDYNAAISDSWKQQTLLNIVRIRYADMPLFVEVASVVSGYTLEGSVNVGRTLSSDSAVQGDLLEFGTAGKYTDRPTITYVPITGAQFNNSFLTPIPPRAILFLMQSGWPVDLILPITVDSINGLRSRVTAGANQRSGDPEYYRVVELLREIQKAGAVGMEIEKKSDTAQETTRLLLHRKRLTPEVEAMLREVDERLGLRRGLREITVTYGYLPRNDSEIAMITRSMLNIIISLATQVDVPDKHVAEGRTVPSMSPSDAGPRDLAQVIRIRHSKEKPVNAFTAAKYRNLWFWIDDRDFKSKRTFVFLMILFSLTETGGKQGLPLVTIPTG